MYLIFVRSASSRDSNKYQKHMVYEEIKTHKIISYNIIPAGIIYMFLNLYQIVIGPTGFPSGRWRSDIDLSRMIDWMVELGFNDTSNLWVILCHLPEKERKKIEELVEEMKEQKWSEETVEIKTFPLYPYLL